VPSKGKSGGRSVSVRDVPPHDFISAYARYLKKSGNVELPKWVDIVKTSHAKELPPQDPDWFFTRCASLARKVYLDDGRHTGIGKYKKVYGSKKRRGSQPNKFVSGSGSIIRACLKQLAKLKVVDKDPKGGRKITSTGQRDLDRIAAQIHTKLRSRIA